MYVTLPWSRTKLMCKIYSPLLGLSQVFAIHELSVEHALSPKSSQFRSSHRRICFPFFLLNLAYPGALRPLLLPSVAKWNYFLKLFCSKISGMAYFLIRCWQLSPSSLAHSWVVAYALSKTFDLDFDVKRASEFTPKSSPLTNCQSSICWPSFGTTDPAGPIPTDRQYNEQEIESKTIDDLTLQILSWIFARRSWTRRVRSCPAPSPSHSTTCEVGFYWISLLLCPLIWSTLLNCLSWWDNDWRL